MTHILLVADVPNWIFHRHCMEIKQRLPQYHMDIAFGKNMRNVDPKLYDLIFILGTCMSYNPHLKEKTVIGIRNECTYGHDENGIRKFHHRLIASRASLFHVVNQKQYEEFYPIFGSECFFCPHGVDIEVFNDFPAFDRWPLVVGSTGNPGSMGKKGFDIIKSACNQLGLELKTATQNLNGKQRTKSEMPEFYRSIDIYVNMSVSEGLNNGILEAGAMGKMVVATPVGAAPEMIISGDTGLICSRSVDSLVKALNDCINNVSNIKQHGRNLQRLIRERWSWDVCINRYNEMFKAILER